MRVNTTQPLSSQQHFTQFSRLCSQNTFFSWHLQFLGFHLLHLWPSSVSFASSSSFQFLPQPQSSILRYLLFSFIYLFGCTGSQLWQAGSLVDACGLLSCSLPAPQLWHVNSQLQHACGIQFPDQGSNPGPLHWEHGLLTTAPPGKSPSSLFYLHPLPRDLIQPNDFKYQL